MDRREEIKQRIIEILTFTPRGLTIEEIKRMLGVSRITATKYIHELLGEGRIIERKIGNYRLLYLNEKLGKKK